jgi:4'-phosphopantetheinyl transferase
MTSGLWLFDLPAHAPTADQLAVLSDDERSRADRLVVEKKRNRFVHARAGLRHLLAQHLGLEPTELTFAYGERGKPYLPECPQLSFNLSHSADKAALILREGVGGNRRIGIDIEDAIRDREYAAFSKRFFATEEQEWLLASDPGAIKDRFYRIWTNKEAYVKALGVGIGFAPGRYALSLEDPSAAVLLRSEYEAGAWRFQTSIPVPGFIMSVCVECA